MNRLLLALFAIVALACSLVAARQTWFSVPDRLTTTDNGAISVIAVESKFASYYTTASLVMGIALFLLWLLGKRVPALTVSLASLWLTVILSFPYAVMVWDPVIAGKATWREGE